MIDDWFAARLRPFNERDEQIRLCRRCGLTYRVIAARFGITPQRVKQILDRCERRSREWCNDVLDPFFSYQDVIAVFAISALAD